MSSFNKSYTDYWKERVDKLSDGTKIADADIAETFIDLLQISKEDVLLDMGCSYGRFFPLLSKFSNRVIGIDIESNAIEKAAEFRYERLETAGLEKMPFDNESIDKGFCWATFDCTEQETVLLECHRILKNDGLILLTGKNDLYEMDDEVAFIAERNAKLKSFPNHFTDINLLYKNAESFGFKVEAGFAFRYRGDFGLAKGIQMNEDVIKTPFYEYLLVLRKSNTPATVLPAICDVFSKTAKAKAEKEKFTNIMDYFNHHRQITGIE